MKRIATILLFVFVVFSVVWAQKRFVMLDKVVAVVGNSSVSYSDVQQYAKQILEQRRAEGYTSDRPAQDEALENLMLQKLLYNQALLDSVEISNGEVAQRVEQQVQSLIDREGSITALEKKTQMPGLESMNCTVLSAPSAQMIIENSETLPMMSDYRLIIVR
ncbi:MAG: SurA N-terminal domain-containing protein, partial [Alistipes sp.]|nr:SurA N-terminal domain-containing protein [Alistipes sp.]